ncbi:MFS transporter, PAT family, solute carrier family 33 (acetyl-CoA transportor), member 1,ACATN, SLC33A1 [Klebsormidium nitens]|uniref:MFS transporter, PAT family, solute carrier family 33 (Acetyl-CoA transportor), member 1,ACATN, SLC33A1 n=1 Tax=Klebsormidium nitens TaxID=105231 RepID=A0A1Y1I9U2_KLENI|nr:MFS transporter, PAT family, solute carrier family 33 (acetyl-CoA transportor), member 1,ACATN, SLC33A1 [Klebsormidium nitens]|eukprot:GAQ86199.1 MFS transporter, PAT family, solute carrier family 33 (acetyl-CoA transportor), member 1,ACATN, SLC33A1 [Klebsormidium nitens]
MQKRLRRESSEMLDAMEEGAAEASAPLVDSSASKLQADDTSDVRNMALLILLYAMQGVPLGLSSGSIPFILKSKASYTEIGIFTLAAYPYSMKLLWSPIVDTVFFPSVGLRKSWILPLQIMSGLVMLFCSGQAEIWLETANIRAITALFFVCVLLAATQDIAVDGWALTLLSRKNVGHASTCQTVGINTGYFLSFTIFLALNDPDFCNSYLRSAPADKGVLSLANYFRFWGAFYILFTAALVFKPETPNPLPRTQSLSAAGLPSPSKMRKPSPSRAIANVVGMYRRLWAVGSLSSVQQLAAVLLLCKLGAVTSEAVGVFKLMEKGVTRETISLIVLIEFPLELFFAVFAGRWATRGRAFSPWLLGYALRLTMALLSTCLVALFPTGATLQSNPLAYFAVICAGVATSFASTLMFVSQGTFFARISDSSMGGTYLTLLNTIANLGSAWPRFFIFVLIDWLTVQSCRGADPARAAELGVPLSCPSKPESGIQNTCVEAGGTCVKFVDGFYPLSLGLISVGVVVGLYFRKRLRDLEEAKADVWRVS